jgi:hypothetical protein
MDRAQLQRAKIFHVRLAARHAVVFGPAERRIIRLGDQAAHAIAVKD